MPSFGDVMDARDAAASQISRGITPAQINAFLRESARGAAVLTELLDSPAWNVFLSNVAGRLEPLKAERETLRNQIEAGALVGDERAKADLRLQYLRGSIEAHTFAMELPKALIAQHQQLDGLAGGKVAAAPFKAVMVAENVVIGRHGVKKAPKPRRTKKRS